MSVLRRSTAMKRTSLHRLPFTAILATAAALSLASCTSRSAIHGDPVDPQRLASIVPSTSTQRDVAAALGSPSTAAPFTNNTWYYISAKMEGFAFLNDTTVQRQVIAISFDPNGVVTDVKTLSLDDGQTIAMTSKETPSFGENITILQQLLGNIGRFEKGQEQGQAPGQ